MKYVRITVVMLSVVMLTSGALLAQSDLSFLSSKAALRAYAVSQASTVQEQSWSISQIGSPLNYGAILATNHTSRDIVKFFDTATPINVVNPNDWVSAYGSVLNADGDQLFWGYDSVRAVLGKGGYMLPSLKLLLTLNSSIPIKFDGDVSQAEFWNIDPISGQTTYTQPLQSWGKKVYVQSDQPGKGILVVTVNGKKRFYDLVHGGVQTKGTVLSVTFTNASIEGMVSLKNPTNITDSVFSQWGIGTNKTYELIMSQPTTTTNQVKVSISTSEGYYPIGLWVKGQNDVDWGYMAFDPGAQSALVPIAGGTSYIVPDWNPLQFREPDPQNWYYGGKG